MPGCLIVLIALIAFIILLNYPWIFLWSVLGLIALFFLYSWYDSWV